MLQESLALLSQVGLDHLSSLYPALTICLTLSLCCSSPQGVELPASRNEFEKVNVGMNPVSSHPNSPPVSNMSQLAAPL